MTKYKAVTQTLQVGQKLVLLKECNSMEFDKDLGFADRYILYDSPTVKVIKLVYKGSQAKLGEMTQVYTLDNDGCISKQIAQFNDDDWFTMVG